MLAKGKGTRLRSQAVREPRLGVHQSFWPTSRTDAIGGSFGANEQAVIGVAPPGSASGV